MLYAELRRERQRADAGADQPRAHAQSRGGLDQARDQAEDSAALQTNLKATELIPLDGIVRKTALEATRGARTDVDKARAIYDWVVANAHREPKTRGCGTGDIKAMLESGNLGGKCADLNALFVGLCRAVGVPARDIYGLRVAPSAFGYRELGAQPGQPEGRAALPRRGLLRATAGSRWTRPTC